MTTPKAKLAAVAILGTLVYLALAVVGWGGFAAFFSHPARIALTGILFMIIPLVARIRSEEALLHSQFGDEYDAYRTRTSRLIPGLY